MKISDLVREILQFDVEQIRTLEDLVHSHDLTMLIGNGGSNSICSHIAQDYTKMLGKRAIAFSDPSRLTCYINDYGMEDAYAKFIQDFHDIRDNGTLVILISSSGNSENIVRSARMCNLLGLKYVTLTGFDKDNRLRTDHSDSSCLDIWVDSHDYGVVECAHQIFLHTIVGEFE